MSPALQSSDFLQIAGIAVAVVAMIVVVAWRKKSYAKFLDRFSDEQVCEHLRPALDLLKSRGHQVVRAGQFDPNAPLEFHISPAFDPHALASEVKLEAPAKVSERGVIYCEEDWCELHPVRS